MRRLPVVFLLVGMIFGADEAYLRWSPDQAKSIADSQTQKGRVGKLLDMRVLHTEHSYNFKLRASWLTPEVIRATARRYQLRNGLSDAKTQEIVAEAEAVDGMVFLVEIDPREGAGIIPKDWVALLSSGQDAAGSKRVVKGTVSPSLRKQPALSGGRERNYAYDVFWVVFPFRTDDGAPLFTEDDRGAELSVRIYGKAGTVAWQIPASIRSKGKHSPE